MFRVHIQTLLREVHQEGMQVLSLSELPAGEGEAGPAGLHSQGWAREREALVATVDSLKNLLAQMTRDTQVRSPLSRTTNTAQSTKY